MIEMKDFWRGRDISYANELTSEIRANGAVTVAKINELLTRSGCEIVDYLNSGWRPAEVNDHTANAAAHSKHLSGQAGDIPDPHRILARWCVGNLDAMGELGLWMEHPGWTPTWVHVQIVAPASGHRVFVPSSAPAADPSFLL